MKTLNFVNENWNQFLALVSAVIFLSTTMGANAGYEEGVAALKNKDYDLALSEFQKESEAGNPDAQEQLARMYRKGLGVEKDKLKAEEFYRQAAEQGHLKAQLELGKLLYNKRGVSSRSLETGAMVGGAGYKYKVKGDDAAKAEAFMWINLAAANSGTLKMPQAKMMREDMHQTMAPPTLFKGERLYQEYIKNIDVNALTELADSGDVSAQFSLGERYAFGDGVMRNPRLAYHWMNMAYGNGLEEARRPRNKRCSQSRKLHEYPSPMGFDYLLIEYYEAHPEAFAHTTIRAMLRDVCEK